MSSVKFNGTEYTNKSLYDMKGSDLVKLHNKLADEVGLPHTNRFSSMKAGVDRTWKLLQQCGMSLTGTALIADKAPKADKAPRAPKTESGKLIDSGVPPEHKGIIAEIFQVAKKVGPVDREKLVDHVLKDVKPPRSKQYDRNYVMGYLAYGLRAGYLRTVEASKA